MSFFDRKEEVVEIQLTPFGKYMLSKGLFRPSYFAFFDNDVLYDSSYGGFVENQKETQDRIKDTPRAKTQYAFNGREAQIAKMQTTTCYDLLGGAKRKQISPVKRYILGQRLGTSDYNSKYMPAWSVFCAKGTISGSYSNLETSQEITKFEFSSNTDIDYYNTSDYKDKYIDIYSHTKKQYRFYFFEPTASPNFYPPPAPFNVTVIPVPVAPSTVLATKASLTITVATQPAAGETYAVTAVGKTFTVTFVDSSSSATTSWGGSSPNFTANVHSADGPTRSEIMSDLITLFDQAIFTSLGYASPVDVSDNVFKLEAVIATPTTYDFSFSDGTDDDLTEVNVAGSSATITSSDVANQLRAKMRGVFPQAETSYPQILSTIGKGKATMLKELATNLKKDFLAIRNPANTITLTSKKHGPVKNAFISSGLAPYITMTKVENGRVGSPANVPIPQIEMSADIDITIEDMSETSEPYQDYGNTSGTDSPVYADGTFLKIKPPDIILGIDELNAPYINENFDIEAFIIEEDENGIEDLRSLRFVKPIQEIDREQDLLLDVEDRQPTGTPKLDKCDIDYYCDVWIDDEIQPADLATALLQRRDILFDLVGDVASRAPAAVGNIYSRDPNVEEPCD